MTPHYPERQLNLGKDFDQKCTSALWARQPNGHAIVFVHGYRGEAVATWSEFHKLLPQTPGFDRHDLIFYGYDGFNATTNASASVFCQFLNRLFEQPLSIINPSLSLAAARPNDFRYQKIILAAHSVGAVTCRWSLLFARDRNSWWPRKTSLVLYAPAHMGARIVKLAQESAAGVLGMIAAYIRFKSPLIDELKEGSPHLLLLLEKTIAAIKTGDSPYLIANQVVFADRDTVVTNLPFAFDPPPITFVGTTHCSVCKPRANFLDPIDILSKAL